MIETDVYAFSRKKMQARRRKTFLRDAIPVLLGAFVVVFFVGLYFEAAWAKTLGDFLVSNWPYVFAVAVLLSGVAWLRVPDRSRDGTKE